MERGVEKPPLKDRFTDNSDGTVTDNLTGLIWLKNANCFGLRTWNNALSDCNGLADGMCGLTDGSIAGDWRLSNRTELLSLIHDGYYRPAISNTAGTAQWTEGDPFTNVQSEEYWSSTTYVGGSDIARIVYMDDGDVAYGIKYPDYEYFVWCLRGGR